MKNIYLIPTDKPSRLIIQNGNKLILGNEEYSIIENRQHIYITSDEKIKEGDLVLSKLNEVVRFGKKFNPLLYKKITLTTDPKLINDGVQGIDDEFLNWFVQNPSCEEVEVIPYLKDLINPLTNEKFPDVQHRHFDETKMIFRYHYKIIIPKEEPKQEITLEEVFNEEKVKGIRELIDKHKQQTLEEAAVFKSHHSEEDFIRGGRWQQEQDKNKFSEEDMREAFENGVGSGKYQFEYGDNAKGCMSFEMFIEQFKKK